MKVERFCIVGLGLIGGSFALALRLAQRMAIRPFPLHLTIVDTDPQTRRAAKKLADLVTDDFATGVREAEVVVMSTPVRTILRFLKELPALRPDGCMVMDLGSSKTEICAAMDSLPEAFQAIGGHPMCGREVSGFGAATPDLFRQHTFILCHTRRTTPAMEALSLTLIDYLGATPFTLPADLHDNMVAVVSHLPYLVAAVLMRNAVAMGDERLWPVSASGFRDTSRLAGTDPRMMLDILLTNKAAVLQQVALYQERLAAVTQFIEDNDEKALFQWLKEVQQGHQGYRKSKTTTDR